jgi:hypothetical protein
MDLHKLGDTVALIITLPLFTAVIVGIRYIINIENIAKQSLSELHNIGKTLDDHEKRLRHHGSRVDVMWHQGDFERRRPTYLEPE